MKQLFLWLSSSVAFLAVPVMASPLSFSLQQLQTKYASVEVRQADPQGFVAAMDDVILRSSFADLVFCRDTVDINGDNTYQVEFKAVDDMNQRMGVTVNFNDLKADGSGITHVTMKMSLVRTVPSVLMTYVHELMHVCQLPEIKATYIAMMQVYESLSDREKEIFNEVDRDDWPPMNTLMRSRLEQMDAAYANHTRQQFLGEVEAVYVMQAAYGEFVEHSSEMAAKELMVRMQKNERELLDGKFAQPIVQEYWSHYKPRERDIFDVSSRSPKFTSAFRQQVENLGIPVVEDL